jgi:hypothetical protein
LQADGAPIVRRSSGGAGEDCYEDELMKWFHILFFLVFAGFRQPASQKPRPPLPLSDLFPLIFLNSFLEVFLTIIALRIGTKPY